MKKIIFFLFVLLLTVACNNSTEIDANTSTGTADSLKKQIDDGHIAGMAKMGRLSLAQQQAARLLDSINRLPAKAQQAASSYKTKIEELLKELSNADSGMNRWMEEYYSKPDSAFTDAKDRVKYLLSEKDKVGKMTDAIAGSLQKADSLLKERF